MKIEAAVYPLPKSYWVIPRRFRAGEYPGSILDDAARGKLRWLLDQGTNYFLDLTVAGEADLKPYLPLLRDEASQTQRRFTHKRMSIRDFATPSTEEMVEILDTIDLALAEGHNIYLHCFGGRGRTGTVVGCYLTRHGMPGGDALEMIKVFRKNIQEDSGQSPETESQRRMVLEWTTGI